MKLSANPKGKIKKKRDNIDYALATVVYSGRFCGSSWSEHRYHRNVRSSAVHPSFVSSTHGAAETFGSQASFGLQCIILIIIIIIIIENPSKKICTAESAVAEIIFINRARRLFSLSTLAMFTGSIEAANTRPDHFLGVYILIVQR